MQIINVVSIVIGLLLTNNELVEDKATDFGF